MSKTKGPQLGEMVRFTQYMGKWDSDDYDHVADGELEKINAKMLPNPDPEKPAMVVGTLSKSIEAMRVYRTHDGRPDGEAGPYYDWSKGKRRTFYVLKRTLGGKRFLVAPEDIQREGGAT